MKEPKPWPAAREKKHPGGFPWIGWLHAPESSPGVTTAVVITCHRGCFFKGTLQAPRAGIELLLEN
jgi:hypothetical protein